MIDVVSDLWVYVTKRVVRQCRQMHHGVEPPQVVHLNVAEIHSERIDLRTVSAERSCLEQEAIQPDNVMTGGPHHGRQNRPDVPVMTRNQDTHCYAALT